VQHFLADFVASVLDRRQMTPDNTYSLGKIGPEKALFLTRLRLLLKPQPAQFKGIT